MWQVGAQPRSERRRRAYRDRRVSQGLRCGLPCRCHAGSTSDPAVSDHVAISTSSHLGRGQPTTRSRRRRGASARTQSPRSVVVINHLNRVRKPCLQLRPAAPDPALHLRREPGDEPGQLGLRRHRSHCIGAAQPRHRNGRKPEPKKRRRRTDQRQAAQRVHFPSPGISMSSLGEDAQTTVRLGVHAARRR